MNDTTEINVLMGIQLLGALLLLLGALGYLLDVIERSKGIRVSRLSSQSETGPKGGRND